MSDNEIAIKVSNLTKTYRLYDKPIDRLKEALHPFKKQYHKNFYALNDVSFEIKKGETVGIIGKNGAGKSTLLKIITGVLTPTSGSVKTYGRISSLLELGAGFNPEMTGIENIYLQGSLFGITHRAMEDNIQEILDFADIGDFIYQPVKSYSSGMFARLAFAVAINVQPDILIVDEALSVGDVRFQRKCFAKFEELKNNNVTIIFVSHDLDSIKAFTSKAIFILDGKVEFEGAAKECVINYLQFLFGKKDSNHTSKNNNIDNLDITSQINLSSNKNISHGKKFISLDKAKSRLNYGNGNADFEYINVYGLNSNIFKGGEYITIEYKINWDLVKIEKQININEYEENIIVGIHLVNKKGNILFGLNSILNNIYVNPRNQNTVKHKIRFKMPYLISDDYFFTAAIAYGKHEHHVQLCWYEDGIELKCISQKKYQIGFLDIECEFTERDNI